MKITKYPQSCIMIETNNKKSCEECPLNIYVAKFRRLVYETSKKSSKNIFN